MRRTKILATLGPATESRDRLDQLLRAGVNAFRINFSHGTDAEHRRILRLARKASAGAHRDVALLADLQGPKIRLGDLPSGALSLVEGREWNLDSSGRPGDARRASVSLPELAHAARPGDPILVGDGNVELVVRRIERGVVITRVVHGGTVSPHAGIFLPHARLRSALLGEKDWADLRTALDEGVDYVALSFVSNGREVASVRSRLGEEGAAEVGLIAKIERAEALRDLESILRASDGIMVARGDLGIEVPLERLAVEQKRLVASARAAHRTVIVATQMLLSMIHSPRPTRAEATDVANAVLDGADAVMLSEESAIGDYPIEAVGWLDRICRSTEEAVARGSLAIRPMPPATAEVDLTVAGAAVALADELAAAAIVTPTHSGRTARLVSGRRPRTPIIGLSSQPSTRRRLALVWGVESERSPKHLTLDQLRAFALTLVPPASPPAAPLVLTAGYPIEGLPTNLVTVLTRPLGRGPRPARVRRGSAGRAPAAAPGRR